MGLLATQTKPNLYITTVNWSQNKLILEGIKYQILNIGDTESLYMYIYENAYAALYKAQFKKIKKINCQKIAIFQQKYIFG